MNGMKKIKINKVVYQYMLIGGIGILSLLFIWKGFTYTKFKDVSYGEEVTSSYVVNLSNREKFTDKEKNSFNGREIETIRTNFELVKDFDYDIKYSEKYYLKARMIVYDREFKNIIKEIEQVITDKEEYETVERKIEFDKYAEIKYQEYLGHAAEIKRNFSLDSNMLLEIVLCSNKESKERELAKIRIPLMQDNFTIGKNDLSDNGRVRVKSKINFINGLCFVMAGTGIYFIYFIIRRLKDKKVKDNLEVI